MHVSQVLKTDCRENSVFVFQEANTSGSNSIVVPIEFRPRLTTQCDVSASSAMWGLSSSKRSTLLCRNILFHHLCRERVTRSLPQIQAVILHFPTLLVRIRPSCLQLPLQSCTKMRSTLPQQNEWTAENISSVVVQGHLKSRLHRCHSTGRRTGKATTASTGGDWGVPSVSKEMLWRRRRRRFR